MARPRVNELLGRLIERHPVVCLFAAAGTGKTTAVLDAASRLERPVAYLTVERTDAATGRLLNYLQAALARVVPEVDGVATEALAGHVPHAEVAGLLADALGESPVILVIDDLERLTGEPDALDILGAFLRYLPGTARAVLCSRSDVRLDLGSSAIRAGVPDGGKLAFTVDEAGAALAARGRADIDPAAAVELTGGWVAGVLYGTGRRSTGPAAGSDAEIDAFGGYLASQILDQLPAADADFLVTTSVLRRINVWRAEALGVTDASERLASLRRQHLPATWIDGELRCHPRFGEYLAERLAAGGAEEAARIRAAHGRLLAGEGHLEEAVDELLAAGALEEALDVVADTLQPVVERADLDLAERWLAALGEERRDDLRLALPRLMLALAQDQYGRAATIAATVPDPDALARESSAAGAMLGWVALHTGRVAEMGRIIGIARPGPPVDALRYCLTLVCDDPTPDPDLTALRGGAFDALVMRVHYFRGAFAPMAEEPASPWAARASEPWRIGALLATGRTAEAATRFGEVPEGTGGLFFSAVLAVKLAAHQGRAAEAWDALRSGRDRIHDSGSVMLEFHSHVVEAELILRLDGTPGDPTPVLAALAPLDGHPAAPGYHYIVEQADTWRGLALLRAGDAGAALAALRRATDSAEAGGRTLCLPAAAVYRAEAAWRAGAEDEADAASDLALDAARRQGSNHQLLEALAEFPAVLSRRLDREAQVESAWHGLGRALRAQRLGTGPAAYPSPGGVRLIEFGCLAVTVDGADVRPRIRKTYELLAYLVAAPERRATREELLVALFEGRADASAGAYLRQAVAQLRRMLASAVTTGPGAVGLDPDAGVSAESVELENLFAEAARQQADARLAALERALGLADAGEYLPGIGSAWAEARRFHLGARTAEARYAAAELYLRRSRYEDAERLAAVVVATDPFAEAAWRLLMQTAAALGDADRVTAIYAGCRAALRELRTEPSAATRQLFEALRR